VPADKFVSAMPCSVRGRRGLPRSPAQIRTCPIRTPGSCLWCSGACLGIAAVDARGPAPVTRPPVTVPGTCFAAHVPLFPPFAPPARNRPPGPVRRLLLFLVPSRQSPRLAGKGRHASYWQESVKTWERAVPDPIQLLLERVNRLGTAVADMMDAHAQQNRSLLRSIDGLGDRLVRLEDRFVRIEDGLARVGRELHGVATEQAALGMSVENAISRALRANVRMDGQEDRTAG